MASTVCCNGNRQESSPLTVDKKALLDELKIDRGDEAVDSGKPIKWFLAIALIGGVAFVAWFVWMPSANSQTLAVQTVIARAPALVAQGDTVLDATGYVVARLQATVSSKATGKVLQVLIEEGMVVEEGQVLAILDDSINRAQVDLAESQLSSSRAGIDELDVQIRQAELDLERTRNLATRNMASKADLDRDQLIVEGLNAKLVRARRDIDVAERAVAIQRQYLQDMEIRAPFAGVVIAKAAQPGEMISPIAAGGGFTNTGICTIVDMTSLEVEVDVNESYINRVYPKQPVNVTLNAYPDVKMAAEVIAIIPAADRNKATVRVRIGFIERDERVMPDMGVKVAFLDDESPEKPIAEAPGGVLVPRSSVLDEGDEQIVYVVIGEDVDRSVDRRTVVVGGRDGGRLRVVSGLEKGERVIAEFDEDLLASLRDGARVSVLN